VQHTPLLIGTSVLGHTLLNARHRVQHRVDDEFCSVFDGKRVVPVG
jgi:hypothetical protein